MGAGSIIAEPIVHDALASMGVAGAIIAVLMTVIAFQSAALAFMWRHSNKVYGYRLAERDTLKDALNSTANVLKEVLAGMRDRNEITEDLSDVVRAHTAAFGSLKEKLELQYEVMKSDTSRIETVIGSMAEAQRTVTLAVSDIKATILLATAEVKGSLAATTASISNRGTNR
jgi:hypothetical protein